MNGDCENETWKDKHWINNVTMEKEEKRFSDSGATTHDTNTEGYMFNKTKDRSSIVVGTRKETKATARGKLIISHSNTIQLIKLKDVPLVPEFQQNIISIPALLKNNFNI